MELHHLLLSAAAAAVLSPVLVAQAKSPPNPVSEVIPPVHVGLCIRSDTCSVGDLCEPFQCTPRYEMAGACQSLTFEIAGVPGHPYVLFYGTPVPVCQPLHGFEGKLALYAPIVTMSIGIVDSVDRPPRVLPECVAGLSECRAILPNNLPAGMDLRFQALAICQDKLGAIGCGFSRAIELRCR